MGDPSGIGPEVIIKALRSVKHLPIIVIGSKKVFAATSRRLRLPFALGSVTSLREYAGGHALLDTIEPGDFRFGKADLKSSTMAMAAIDQAIDLARKGILKGFVTAPINKAAIRPLRRSFVGHTEYFARKFNVKNYGMMGISQDRRILLLTTHMPLQRVFKHITIPRILASLKLLDWGLRVLFRIKSPRIGVTNLNPHGLEFSLGEDETIAKAVARAGSRQIRAAGPFPADAAFNLDYDGFLAMYHDQAMVFLKARPDGVNFTMGLPIIRTSPLHGTAADIAGKNKADPRSMIAAIKVAAQLSKNI